MRIKEEKDSVSRKNLETYIGKDAKFEGHLKFFGTIRIEGFFKGEISGDGTLVIGKEGKLESNVHVTNIIIFGEVYGDIIAEKRVDIQSAGKVIGNIETPTIGIEQGAIFEGNCATHQIKIIDEEKRIMVNSIESKKKEPDKLKTPGLVYDGI